MERYHAIYGRQSVDKLDSISIESQIEFCRYETRGEQYRVYQDKGYSGKNTDRPQFQKMLADMRAGQIKSVIVYKLDRMSRSILDFANLMEELQSYGVSFVSCTEKFDTATPMGRAMLNICIVFAQLERETIQMRVRDAYHSRSKKGFYMGGRVPYGYRLEPYFIEGKRTAHYVPEPLEAETVRFIFEGYAQSQTSFGELVKLLRERGMPNSRSKNGAWNRSRLADMVKNPIYVKADLAIYEFYQSQGAVLENDASDYIGTKGCYLYTGEGAGRKTVCLEGQHVVLAPHEGIVSSEVWLKARAKCLQNGQIAKPIKAKNSFLVGKVKCSKCGYALTVKKSKSKVGRYFICTNHLQMQACEGVGGIYAGELERVVAAAIMKRIHAFGRLSPIERKTDDIRLLEVKIKLAQLDDEIEKLLDKLSEADQTLMGYIQKRVSELDRMKKAMQASLSEKAERPKEKAVVIADDMAIWDALSFTDKRAVVDALIHGVVVGEEEVLITWKV